MISIIYKNISAIIFIAIFSITFSGCSRDDYYYESNDNLVITAVSDAKNISRTILNDAGKIEWVQGDDLSVWMGGATMNHAEMYGVLDDKNKSYAKFVIRDFFFGAGSENDATDGYNAVALYPYDVNAVRTSATEITTTFPSIQYYMKNSFSERIPMVAIANKSYTTEFLFKNIAAWMCVGLTDDNAKSIRKLVLSSVENPLAGSATINISNVNEPVVEIEEKGSKSITLDCGEAGVRLSDDVTRFYISIPPIVAKSFDLQLTVYDTDGNSKKYNFTKENNFERNAIITFGPLEYDAEPAETAKFELPNKTMLLAGASISQYNGYFEYAMKKLGITGTNISDAGKNILHLCYKLYKNSYATQDVLIISHIHNYDVYSLPASLESRTAEQYENDALLAPYLTTDQYISGDITPPEGYSVNEMYAIGYDYAIKKWIEKCGKIKDKEPQIVLMTYWHDGRTIYNNAIRRLSNKWGFPLIKEDENIGFCKYELNPTTGKQWSISYCNGIPWSSKIEVIDGVTYGFHPSGISKDKWSSFLAADAETMLEMLPDIQIRRATIMIDFFKNVILF